jgi:DNA-binding NarL/FixJ family response regulator
VSGRPRVLIADDHAPTRSDIRRTLDEDGRFEVCAEAVDAPSAVAAAIRRRPDICVLDIRMPGSGIGAAWEITARLPSTKVVMLTVSRDDDHLFAALRAGAAGYLLKDVDPHRLPEELQAVLDGESALPRNLVGRLMETFRDHGARRRALVDNDLAGQLTSREWQVLELMRSGLSTAQLAQRLTLSQATVRSHIAAILRKLRVPDREAAIRLFEER